MFKQITIYHGVKNHSNFVGYEDGDPVAPVFTYVVTWVRNGSIEEDAVEECHRAFRMFNAPAEFLGGQDAVTAAQYNVLRIRSLSIGDLIAVGTRVYACTRDGFRKVNGQLNVCPSTDMDEVWAVEVYRRSRVGR